MTNSKVYILSLVWWHILVIPSPGRLWQEDPRLDHIARLHIRKEKKRGGGHPSPYLVWVWCMQVTLELG